MAIQLTLNADTYELAEAGWGKTLSAQQFVVDGPLDKDLWREPLTGALMLRPGPMSAEWRESGAFEAAKLGSADFHLRSAFWETIYTKTGQADPFLSTVYATGSDEDDIAYDTGIDLTGLASSYGGSLVWAAQSMTNFGQNQGLYLEMRHFGFDFEKVSNYFALMLGQYGLRLQTDGVAVLYQHDQQANSWTSLMAMRFCGQSEQHGNSVSLLILPVLGNRLHFYFSTGRAVNAAFDHQRTPGPRDYYYSYRLPVEDEAWDPTAKVWRVIDEAPLRFAVAPGRRYFLQAGRVVFSISAKTAKLGHDDIGLARTIAPELTLHCYLPGNSTMSGTVLDHSTGSAFLTGTDTQPQPQVTLHAASNGYWSPELHAVTVDIREKTQTVSRGAIDVSADVRRLRLRLHNDTDAQELEAELRDPDGRYAGLRGKVGIPCSLSLGGQAVFAGESVDVDVFEAPGPPVLRMRFRDGWRRLESVRLGPEISYDGQKHTDVMRRVLNRAGFPDSVLAISTEDVQLPGGGQTSDDPNAVPLSPAANDWRFAPKPADTPADVARLITAEFSGWRLRHDAGIWRYKPKPTSTTATRYMVWRTQDYDDLPAFPSYKTRAFNWHETALPPDFDVLCVYGVDATGGEVERLMAIECNSAAISSPASDDFLGCVQELNHPASWAPTVEACSRVARLLMDDRGHTRRLATFEGEWKPAFAPDTMVQVYGPGFESLGVWRIDEVEVTVERDLPHLYRARWTATRVAE